jgi:hypothetical protein
MFDSDAAMQGTIPWNADECSEVMAWYHDLVSTPKDDWDLNERGIAIEDEEGSVTKLQFNQFHAMNQLGFYMANRFDECVMPYHTFRFMQIMDFLQAHLSELHNDGLARVREDDGEDVCRELLQALCELPYSKVCETRNGGQRRDFDYDDVVRRTREIQKESPS